MSNSIATNNAPPITCLQYIAEISPRDTESALSAAAQVLTACLSQDGALGGRILPSGRGKGCRVQTFHTVGDHFLNTEISALMDGILPDNCMMVRVPRSLFQALGINPARVEAEGL